MTVLRWQSAMHLGIPAIDTDHKRLVGLLNRLHYAVLAGDDDSGIAQILDDLVGYTQIHFAREEALMQRIGYPDLQSHRGVHERIGAKMQALLEAYRQSPADFDVDGFYDFVSGWLLHHVLGDDMKLKPYVARMAATAYA